MSKYDRTATKQILLATNETRRNELHPELPHLTTLPHQQTCTPRNSTPPDRTSKPWQDMSMDFVTGLPSSAVYDTICVIIDRFTKQYHIISCTTAIDAEEFAEQFIRQVFRLHGLSQTAISDRGPMFIVAFWKCLCKRLDNQLTLSSPYHP